MTLESQTPKPMTLSERLAAIRKSGSAPASGTVVAREFELRPADFERVRKLIYARAGISLSPSKQDMVYSRLARRLRAKGMKNFSDYLDFLEKGRDAGEWELFVNSLTTNLTSFFREPHHFPMLAEHLKKIAARRKQISIWCCAASTGEEPYSIAMTVAETFAAGSGVQVNCLCSDLDTQVLATAEKGIYSADRVARIPAAQLQRHFQKMTDGNYSANAELRRMMRFTRINLLEANWPVRGTLDVIFCRNVMIYFDKPTQYKILSRFAPLMQPDGLLFAGHSENFLHAADLFRSLGKTVYERVVKS
ncbi:MAG: chemotaxis protein CheR [Zoogloeaceae bacterium]|jgi:chemotaxis protein methyltransferase CheR|nr:chemotaxis protein CheR [Zoogloeaceae bacterium]